MCSSPRWRCTSVTMASATVLGGQAGCGVRQGWRSRSMALSVTTSLRTAAVRAIFLALPAAAAVTGLLQKADHGGDGEVADARYGRQKSGALAPKGAGCESLLDRPLKLIDRLSEPAEMGLDDAVRRLAKRARRWLAPVKFLGGSPTLANNAPHRGCGARNGGRMLHF